MSLVKLVQFLSDLLSGFNIWAVTFRLLLAAVLGGFIGLERGRHGRAAGLRTHILVCIGAAMTALVGLYTSSVLNFGSDPLRVGAQVISGIGFLGAGTIMTRNQSQITGLTTAAALWATAGLGLAIGVGSYSAVFIAFAVVWITISILPRLERSIKQSDKEPTYYIELNDISKVNDLLALLGGDFSAAQIIPPKSGAAGHVGVTCILPEQNDFLSVVHELDYVVIFVPLPQ